MPALPGFDVSRTKLFLRGKSRYARHVRQPALSQAEFAKLLGVSVRTLQEWEQGRRAPSGAAATLLRIAARHPAALMELAA